MADDFETALIHLEHDLDRLSGFVAPSHFADRLADDADRLLKLSERLRKEPKPVLA